MLCIVYNIHVRVGKVKTTGEIYVHKMQVNHSSQQQGLATSVKETGQSAVADVSAATLPPAMPSLDETQDTPSVQQPEKGEEVEGEGGQEDAGGVEGEDTVADGGGGGEEECGEGRSQPQTQ